MVNDVTKMSTKWLETQEALRKARQVRIPYYAAAVEGVEEPAWDKTIEFDPIFPDEKTFVA